MDERKLNLVDPDLRENEGFINGVAVIESIDPDDGEKMISPIHEMALAILDKELYIAIGNINGTNFYPLENKKSIDVNEEKGEITFSSYGRIYTVRAFQDSDGSWASKLGAIVPADSIEERYMVEIENAFSPNAPADDENLYAAVDESGEVKFFVYSSNAGMYTRSSEGWFRVPENDESLDDLFIHEMDPKAIKIFDMAEASGDTVMIDDLKKYEIEYRGTE